MILGMGVPEIAIILLVVLVIFGPKNLPKLGSAIGKTVKNVREGMEDGVDETPEAEPAVERSSDDDAVS
ncbi:MAG TPA: twin-arginine translocase TatA/TatE family subunit [Olsenella sp.]|nr:twin-arginine translocase TatA/TatE family subunit [Olsenella sp.]